MTMANATIVKYTEDNRAVPMGGVDTDERYSGQVSAVSEPPDASSLRARMAKPISSPIFLVMTSTEASVGSKETSSERSS